MLQQMLTDFPKFSAGWRGDGLRCDNVDECAESIHLCDPLAECTDTRGKFFLHI